MTGVPGLDTVLGGGLIEGGLYLIEGVAGTGKTILSSQIAFNQVRAGRRVLYLTLIAESHAKLLQHLRGLDFYDSKVVSESLIFISAYDKLAAAGLAGLLELIANSIKASKPALLVVDGFRSAREVSPTDLGLSHFIHQLNALVTATRCTTLLLAPLSGTSPQPEHTLVDGFIELNWAADGMRRAREIEVHKMRASEHLLGKHAFKITKDGISIFPRLEALQMRRTSEPSEASKRLPFGVKQLDEMVSGGLLMGSTTQLLGPPGCGKSILALSFLNDGVRNGESCLYFGFYESPERLLATTRSLGMELEQGVERGNLAIVWQPPLEQALDELGARLLDAVRSRKVSRLVIDGIEGFRDTTMYPQRTQLFMAALANELKALNVTTMITEELSLYAPLVEQTAFHVSAVIENIILLRSVELRSRFHRLISVLKLRESHHDSHAREFVISPRGIEVDASSEGAERVFHDRRAEG